MGRISRDGTGYAAAQTVDHHDCAHRDRDELGVESTAREAWQHNYNVVVAEDACSSMGPEMHQFAVQKIFPRIALVRSTAEVLGAVR